MKHLKEYDDASLLGDLRDLGVSESRVWIFMRSTNEHTEIKIYLPGFDKTTYEIPDKDIMAELAHGKKDVNIIKYGQRSSPVRFFATKETILGLIEAASNKYRNSLIDFLGELDYKFGNYGYNGCAALFIDGKEKVSSNPD